jgi:peptidoglycan/LPS O-acetylase OafA/YrhL
LVAVIAVGLIVALPVVVQGFLSLGGDLTEWLVFLLPPSRLPEFVFGCLLALHISSGGRIPCSFRLALASAAALLTAITVFDVPSLAPAITVVPFCLVIASAAQRDVARKPSLFARPWLVTLGAWSFAFYLLHELVIRVLTATVGPGSTLAQGLFLGAGALALSVAAAGLMYVYLEVPAERRWRRGSRPRAADSVPVAAADR